jgi:hypothetical protein
MDAIIDFKLNTGGFVQIMLAVSFLLLFHQLQLHLHQPTSTVMELMSHQMNNAMRVSPWKMEMAVVLLVKFKEDGYTTTKESLNVSSTTTLIKLIYLYLKNSNKCYWIWIFIFSIKLRVKFMLCLVRYI